MLPAAGDVRGKGLMAAIELVVVGGQDPNLSLTARVMEETKQRGLLVGKGGLRGNVLRIAPPLTLTEEECDEGLAILADAPIQLAPPPKITHDRASPTQQLDRPGVAPILRMGRCYHRSMRSDSPLLAPTFRSRAQGDLLALVLLHPNQEWTISELARRLALPVTSVQSEVTRLAQGGVLATRKVGRARVVRANTASPAVAPLTQLTLVTFGPQTVIADEFNGLGADRVLVFGSWAARYHGEVGGVPADIDVLLLGDGVDRGAAYTAAERAEARLGMPVNPVLRPAGSWDDPDGDALVLEVQARPYVDVTGRQSS